MLSLLKDQVMPTITLLTHINAPIERCFDLSRSIDLHTISNPGTKESAIAGTTTGLINEGETVTWTAIHLGFRQQLTSKVTTMHRPMMFVDEMMSGAFKSMRHEHHFEIKDGITTMKDVFNYEIPMGFLGQLFDKLILCNYMKKLLEDRNGVIKQYAEGNEWSRLLKTI